MVHKLKILPEYFEPIVRGEKTFELRKDDRGYNVGDILDLMEWNLNGHFFTGRMKSKRITYILRNAPQYGLMDGYCILGLEQ